MMLFYLPNAFEGILISTPGVCTPKDSDPFLPHVLHTVRTVLRVQLRTQTAIVTTHAVILTSKCISRLNVETKQYFLNNYSERFSIS